MTVASVKSASDGIAREAALFREGRPAHLLWQADCSSLVVPTSMSRRAGFAGAASMAAKAGWTVTTRSSGGGIVPQGPCTLNLAMVVPCPPGFTHEDGYRTICGSISDALMQFLIPSGTGAREAAFCDGTWNVLSGGRKLAGTAQRWRMTTGGPVALIHAAILIARPDRSLWPVLSVLHEWTGSADPAPRPNAHFALDELMPMTMNKQSFPRVLASAAEDRLARLTDRKEAAA